MKSAAQMLAQFEEALAFFEAKPDGVARHSLATVIYQPDARFAPLLARLRTYIANPPTTLEQQQDAGRLLEQIATVAFDCIRGRDVIKSYRSAEAQYDLLVNGTPPAWDPFWRFTRLEHEGRGVLVECKATKSRVGAPVFARLCDAVAHTFQSTVALGVFFTLSGATGFPTKGNPRQQKLGDARLRQVLFYAATRKPIVVFDQDDILSLSEPGSLLVLLERKIRDIEEISGLPSAPASHSVEVDLPKHLKDLLPASAKLGS
jgi:hypothetical protein